jgi:purine-binding chemotaxis protein CheW
MEMMETAVMTQCLTFRLGEESYALDVGRVREVLEMTHITPLPRAPEYLRGVINVRGSVVPVVDLRLKLAMKRIESTIDTCIIVLDIDTGEGLVTVGSLVDAVEEVVDFDSSRIEPPPRIGAAVRTEFIQGIGKREERFVMILDIQKVFAEEDLAALAEAERTRRETPG